MTEEQLRELYITQDLSQREVAKQLNCSHGTIRHYLKKFSIVKLIKKSYGADGIKTCPVCQKTKSINDFYQRGTDKKGKELYQSSCKDCANQKTVERQQENKREAVKYMGGSCKACGFNKYDGALEFHHLNPEEKDFNFSHFNRSLSDEIKKELDKCVLLCANCHRMIHAGLITL